MKVKGERFLEFIGENHPDPDHCISSYTEMAKMAEDYAEKKAIGFRMWCHQHLISKGANGTEKETIILYQKFKDDGS